MKYILILLAICLNVSAMHAQEQPFHTVVVKKITNGKLCESCKVDFALSAETDFSYMIIRSGHTPNRFYPLLRNKKREAKSLANRSISMISNGHIGITFLPNFLLENGKRLQLYRNFGGEDYSELEFETRQNNRVIRTWTPILSLGKDEEFVVMGAADYADPTMKVPWPRTFNAGFFDLAVNDSLSIIVRNIQTKTIVKTIMVVRPADKPTNFIYYQMPLADQLLSTNLQGILNYRSGIPKVTSGDSSSVFEKDYNSIGILRFIGLNENEELEYSFGKKPFSWQSIKALDPETGIFLVLSADMPSGKDQEIFLRYKSQPETIHQVTIKVKDRPFQPPWAIIAMVGILSIIVGGFLFYLRERRNKRRLADIESRLSLLSGQLNPHFLFNTLSAIQGTINSNSPDKANAYIGNVAGFMRDVMDSGRMEFVSLLEELKLEENYLRLEQQRMAFGYTITIDQDLEPSLIDFPPLLLQPVLENSIRHAFDSGLTSSELKINVYSLDRNLIIKITDNGRLSWDASSVYEGHGLSLVRKRIVVYNEKLKPMSILMRISYVAEKGTMTTFTFQNWLV